MIPLAIRVDSNLSKIEDQLAKAQRRVQQAIANGLNEGGDKVRTLVRAAMQEQTSLRQLKSVTSRSSTIRAFPGAPKSGIGPSAEGTLAYVIVFRGRPATKIEEFKFSARRGPGGGVTAFMWGAEHRFARSFKSTTLGLLRARLGSSRFPIRSFDGPNLAKEAIKDKVASTFLEQAPIIVPPMIAKHLAKALF